MFRGFRSVGDQNFRFHFDFAGHRYNSAAATAQPVIGSAKRPSESAQSLLHFEVILTFNYTKTKTFIL